MKTKYVCETCGFEHSDRYTMEFHEREHKPTLVQYTANKPTLGKAILEAVVKEYNNGIPAQVLVSYNGKHAWYKLQWAAPWEDSPYRPGPTGPQG